MCNSFTRHEAIEHCRHADCPTKEEPNPVSITVTQQDLDNNPDLVAEGLKVGDVITAYSSGAIEVIGGPPEPHLPVNMPLQGDPGDEQPIENRSIIGKIADFITGK